MGDDLNQALAEGVDWSTLEFLHNEDSIDPAEAIIYGHHDAEVFRAGVQAELDSEYGEGQFRTAGNVRYGWARKVPDRDHRWIFWPVGTSVRDGRGVFQYTAVDVENCASRPEGDA